LVRDLTEKTTFSLLNPQITTLCNLKKFQCSAQSSKLSIDSTPPEQQVSVFERLVLSHPTLKICIQLEMKLTRLKTENNEWHN